MATGGLLLAAPAEAQTATDAETVKELGRQLESRDAVIQDLLRRVEQLEARGGLEGTPGTAPPAAAPPAPAVSTAVPAPSLRPEPPLGAAEPAATVAAPEPVTTGQAEPARPGQFEVDEEAIDRALERALVQTGALLLPPGVMEVVPSVSYRRGQSDFPLVREVAGATTVVSEEVRRNMAEAALTFRLGLPWTSQFEVGVPYGYEHVSTVTRVGRAGFSEFSRDAWGLGDVSVSLSKELLREDGWTPDLIAAVDWEADTGERKNDLQLGSGFNSLGFSLTATKRQDPLVFLGGLNYRTSFEKGGIGPGDQYGLVLGTVLAASPDTSLRFVLQQTFVEEARVDGRRIPGSDQVASGLLLGGSTVLAPRALLDVSVGIGLTEDADDYSIRVALPIRFQTPFF